MRILRIQKRAIRIIETKQGSWKQSFISLNIITMTWEYFDKLCTYVTATISKFPSLGCSSHNTAKNGTLEMAQHNLKSSELNFQLLASNYITRCPSLWKMKTWTTLKRIPESYLSAKLYTMFMNILIIGHLLLPENLFTAIFDLLFLFGTFNVSTGLTA